MFPFLDDENYVRDFEKNVVKSYDYIKKEKKYGDSIYVHINDIEKNNSTNNSILKKKIYLLGLNYRQYIYVGGNFRFRLIKGLIEFNGQIIKPSNEYINVRIPFFYPLFKLTTLNINVDSIKKKGKQFFFELGIKDNNENKENEETKENKQFFVNESLNSITKNYMNCLSLLPDENEKKIDFFTYISSEKEKQIKKLSSTDMLDIFQENLYFEKYPVIIAFHRKKDFLYYLYHDNENKLNISDNKQNRSGYMNMCQFNYALKEFIEYICNRKCYDLKDIVKKVEIINGDIVKWGNEHTSVKEKQGIKSILIKTEENELNNVRRYSYGINVDIIDNISCDIQNDVDEEIKMKEGFDIYSLLLIGDKNKGKSFLVIKFINSLLNYYNSIILIDVDIGQPIIGISGFLSIYKIKYPLNNYNFFEKRNKCIKRIFYGSCRINDNLPLYINCLKYIYHYLYFEYLEKKKNQMKKKKENNKRKNKIYPLVVNTFGWITDIGLEVLKLNISLSKCDFIIQLDSLKLQKHMKEEWKRELKFDKLYHSVFNDFLWFNKKEENIHTIINMRNNNINIIPKNHSFLQMLKKNDLCCEHNFYLLNFSVSFLNSEKATKKRYILQYNNTCSRNDENVNYQHTTHSANGISEIDVCKERDVIIGTSDKINEAKNIEQKVTKYEEEKNVDTIKKVNSNKIEETNPILDFSKEAEEYFLHQRYIRIMNFISFKKIKKYENIKKGSFQEAPVFISPRNLRSYRFFCHFFYKFEKLIFYIHSFSVHDRIIDFFNKHKNYVNYVLYENGKNLYEKGNGKEIEQAEKQCELNCECENANWERKTERGKKEENDSNSNYNNYQWERHHNVNIFHHKRKKLLEKEKLYRNPWNNMLYFTCAVFYLKNVKLSNIKFSDEFINKIYSGQFFDAQRYFFNNIVCLCYDDTERNINGKKKYGETNIDAFERKVIFYIDHLHINTNFKRVDYFIKGDVLRRNNVELISLKEHLQHIITAYIKIINDMKLIIYLPYWFKEFDKLKRVNTFVSGYYLNPDNIYDMFDNYYLYMNIVSQKKTK